MSDLAFTLTALHAEDREPVERLHARVFGPGRFARTAARIREEAASCEDFGFVARVASLLVAAVQVVPVRLVANDTPMGGAFMLGPLAVDPAFEGRGIGRALLARAAEEARAQGGTLLLLVGDFAYYQRAGYVRVPLGQIRLDGPVDPARLLAFELQPGALAKMHGLVHGGTSDA